MHFKSRLHTAGNNIRKLEDKLIDRLIESLHGNPREKDVKIKITHKSDVGYSQRSNM